MIYRHYATLYFVFAVDKQESDLGILDLIQVFVEALDKCFENVCELDSKWMWFPSVCTPTHLYAHLLLCALCRRVVGCAVIFHSDKVNYALDEIVSAGMVLETSITQVLQGVNQQNKMYRDSMTSSKPTLPTLSSSSSGVVGPRG